MKRRFFIAGFTWDGESQKDRFIKDGIWENGYDEKYKEIYDKIRIGDYFALKSTYVKDKKKSCLRVHCIGIVKDVSKESMQIYVDWIDYTIKDITEITWYANTLCEITDEDHIFKIFGITKIIDKMFDIKELLLANHNIILTGAPGTGKTYLAKQIAQQMIFGELKKEMSDEEKKQFKEQCGFVQFHPSYDYTDFVEGLRPKSGNGNIGFKPIDGVFKEFCSNALENFLDAQKSEEELQKEIPISVRIEKFIQDSIVDTNKSFNTKKGNSFHIINNDKRKIQIEIIGSGNETLDLSKKRLISLLEKDNGTVKCASDIKKIFGNKYTNRKDSYIFPLYEDLKSKSNSQTDSLSSDVSNNSTVDKINKKNYVFIIDEINRGEISKIFGELFFSIDPGYRGTKGAVRTQYANMQTDIGEPNDFDDELGITEPENFGHFFVPENVYIIGTMNDIDRSVESMDFAFRRRFAFKEITAEETQSMLDSADAWNGDMPDSATIEEIKKRMDNLNKIIWHKNEKDENDEQKSIEGLSSAYHIGASYFLKLANYKNEDDSYNFDELWEYHLEGLLFEYLRGTTDVYKKLKRLATAYGYIKVDKYE